MPITRDEATALAELLCTIRPQWNTRGVIVKGLGPLAKHPAPLEVIAWAAIRAAQDTNNLTPAVIPLNGPHWNLADRPPTPRLTPDLMCPRHIGQWAGNCPECSAERLGRTEPGDDVTDDDVLTAKDRALATARRIREEQQAADNIDRPLEDDQAPDYAPGEVHVHRYKPVRDGELYGKPRYRNTCACGERETPEPDETGVPSDEHPKPDPTERNIP